MKTAIWTKSTQETLISQVQLGKVKQVIFKPNRIEYTLQPAFGRQKYYLSAPSQIAELKQTLTDNQVPFEDLQANSDAALGVLGAILSTGVLAAGVALLARRNSTGGGGIGVGMGMGVGKSQPKQYDKAKGKVTFADVAGVDESKQELQEVVDFLANGEKYRRIGAKIPKGVLLVGPPGTGKTLIAKAVAGEADVPFLSMSGSEFVEVFVGVGASRVRDLFNRAKRQAPCIIFIDEIDAIGKTRSASPTGGNDEREQTLNQLLTEMDGFDGNDGVIVIAATNRPEMLDPALRRPGRFDRQVLVDRPDKSGRFEILRVHAQPVMLSEEVNFDEIATRTAGFVGADLANLVNEAALMAARHNRQAVLMADFDEAIERVVAGLEKRSRVLTPLERQTVAYHEMGHALVGALMPGGHKVSKISIVPRGMGALGYTLQTPESDRFLMLEDELRGNIATLLGGRAAEEIVFRKVSTGASDDIQKATDLAERAITQYGMSASLGPVAFVNHSAQFLEQTSSRRAMGTEVAEEIDRQVKQTIDQARTMAIAILNLNRGLLESATQCLLQQEVLEGAALQDILAQVKSPPSLETWLAPNQVKS